MEYELNINVTQKKVVEVYRLIVYIQCRQMRKLNTE